MTDRPGPGRGTLIAGGLVLLAGLVWLLSTLGVDIRWEMVLAVALIGVGIALLALSRSEGGSTPLIIAGVVITAVLTSPAEWDSDRPRPSPSRPISRSR